MHKGIILLVKAKDGLDAKNQANKFMEYQCNEGGVGDWYQIGGRWQGKLDKYDPYKDPKNIKTCDLCGGTGLRNDFVGKELREKDPNYTCNGCYSWDEEKQLQVPQVEGQIGKIFEWPTQWNHHEGDILPLKDCIDVVKEWAQDPQAVFDEKIKEAEERWGKTSKEGYNKDMYGYSFEMAGTILQECFCCETNVYNLEVFNYFVPEDLEGWFAVMMDMHH